MGSVPMPGWLVRDSHSPTNAVVGVIEQGDAGIGRRRAATAAVPDLDASHPGLARVADAFVVAVVVDGPADRQRPAGRQHDQQHVFGFPPTSASTPRTRPGCTAP